MSEYNGIEGPQLFISAQLPLLVLPYFISDSVGIWFALLILGTTFACSLESKLGLRTVWQRQISFRVAHVVFCLANGVAARALGDSELDNDLLQTGLLAIWLFSIVGYYSKISKQESGLSAKDGESTGVG